MPDWLVVSLIASLLLTLGVNALMWIFPGIGRSTERRFLDRMENRIPTESSSRVHVVFPWKLMLIVSIGGTLLLNLFL